MGSLSKSCACYDITLRFVHTEKERPALSHDTKDILAYVDRLAAEEGMRLTPIRRRVLEIMLQSHKALGAYDLLPYLEQEGLGNKPVAAYRALDFLMSKGLVHRIEGMNAYVACDHPHENHAPAFMVCRDCKSVSEAHAAPEKGQLGQAAKEAGFEIERTVVEAVGLCAECQGSAAQ